jgi:predicted DNA-binding protein with PD1-like motif
MHVSSAMSDSVNWALARLMRGDVLPDALIELARFQGWKSGAISAIGAVSDLELAYYDLPTKSYLSHKVEGTVEVVSMNGNLSIVDDLPFWHIHMVVSDSHGRCSGGHLVHCKIALTLECSIWPSFQYVTREVDPELGLKLLKL